MANGDSEGSLLSFLKQLLTVSILFSAALGIFCIVTIIEPPIKLINLYTLITNIGIELGTAFCAFSLCVTHIIIIKSKPENKYYTLKIVMGTILLILSVAYFVWNMYIISNPLYCNYNYQLCELQMTQFIVLPLVMSITIFLDQFECKSQTYQILWIKHKLRVFIYSFIFCGEAILNIYKLIKLPLLLGIIYNKSYFWVTIVINVAFGGSSLAMMIVLFLMGFNIYKTNNVDVLRCCYWTIVISASCMMLCNIYTYIHKLDYMNETAWLLHCGLVFVTASFIGCHDTNCCIKIYTEQYQDIADQN